MKKIRTAVVGVGHLGRLHAAKHAAIEDVELVGVCDLRSGPGMEVATALGVTFYPDHKSLVDKIDAVTIAADTSAHFELAKFFLEHGVHVLVEKPMTATSAEGRALSNLAERAGLKLQVGHVERFNPALLSARERLRKVKFIECHRLAPFKGRGDDVNVVLDLMIHDLDVILSLMEGQPAEISAVGISVLTPSVDIANARIEFDTGSIANVTASRVSTSTQRKFRVFQENQYLSIDFGAGEVQLVTHTGDEAGGQPTLKEERWSLEKGDALLAETRAFVESIRHDQPCQVSGRDGVAALSLAEQIIEAIERRSSCSSTTL